MTQERWTRPSDVVSLLQKRFDRGDFLRQWAAGQSWEPYPVPIKGPTARALGDNFAAAQEWAHQWLAQRPRALRLETREVGGRLIGANQVPARIWVDTYEAMWNVLGVEKKVRRYAELLEQARAGADPGIAAWMAEHPRHVLADAHIWPQLVATTEWIAHRAAPGIPLRHIDVPAVDTKFVENHKSRLADLLDTVLPPDRIDDTVPRGDFIARYRFAAKPEHVRLRRLGRTPWPFPGVSEITVRVHELAKIPLTAATVYVVENETTYLAFPEADDALVVFGGGYAAGSRLAALPWLGNRSIIYWGDIDTHGFAILDRLRRRFPHVRSMLMNRETLLGHEAHWVTEPSPHRGELSALTLEESALYRELQDDRFGRGVRLEQERVRFGHVVRAVQQTHV